MSAPAKLEETYDFSLKPTFISFFQETTEIEQAISKTQITPGKTGKTSLTYGEAFIDYYTLTELKDSPNEGIKKSLVDTKAQFKGFQDRFKGDDMSRLAFIDGKKIEKDVTFASLVKEKPLFTRLNECYSQSPHLFFDSIVQCATNTKYPQFGIKSNLNYVNINTTSTPWLITIYSDRILCYINTDVSEHDEKGKFIPCRGAAHNTPIRAIIAVDCTLPTVGNYLEFKQIRSFTNTEESQQIFSKIIMHSELDFQLIRLADFDTAIAQIFSEKEEDSQLEMLRLEKHLTKKDAELQQINERKKQLNSKIEELKREASKITQSLTSDESFQKNLEQLESKLHLEQQRMNVVTQTVQILRAQTTQLKKTLVTKVESVHKKQIEKYEQMTNTKDTRVNKLLEDKKAVHTDIETQKKHLSEFKEQKSKYASELIENLDKLIKIKREELRNIPVSKHQIENEIRRLETAIATEKALKKTDNTLLLELEKALIKNNDKLENLPLTEETLIGVIKNLEDQLREQHLALEKKASDDLKLMVFNEHFSPSQLSAAAPQPLVQQAALLQVASASAAASASPPPRPPRTLVQTAAAPPPTSSGSLASGSSSSSNSTSLPSFHLEFSHL